MDAQSRLLVVELRRSDVPEVPGVYAFYLGRDPVYVGMAKGLRERVWGDHMSQSKSMRTSSLRRNIAEQFGVASARDIYAKRHRCSPEELALTRARLEEFEVAWIETESAKEAEDLETEMKAEWMPPLTKI